MVGVGSQGGSAYPGNPFDIDWLTLRTDMKYSGDFVSPVEAPPLDGNVLAHFDFAKDDVTLETVSGVLGTPKLGVGVESKLECAPICEADTPTCLGSVAGTCNPPGTGLVTATDCALSGQVCNGGVCVTP